MSNLTSPETRTVAQGETNRLYIDWGENTAGEKTGCLSAGDTVASCAVSVHSKPSGAADPTLGSVTIPTQSSQADDINGRTWSTGEATVCTIQTAIDQAIGLYVLKFVATTANSNVLPRYFKVQVSAS